MPGAVQSNPQNSLGNESLREVFQWRIASVLHKQVLNVKIQPHALTLLPTAAWWVEFSIDYGQINSAPYTVSFLPIRKGTVLLRSKCDSV